MICRKWNLWRVGIIALGLVIACAIIGNADAGAIWTTFLDCSQVQQNINQFYVWDSVYIHGENFAPGIYNWDITGQPNSGDPSTAVAYGTVTVGVDGNFCFWAYQVQPDDWGVYKYGVDKKNDNYSVVGHPISVTVSGLNDLTVTQPLIGTWSSLSNGLTQSLGSLTVSITAYRTVSYTTYVWYSVAPNPSPAFSGDPLLYEYATSSGNWTTIPPTDYTTSLPGLTGGTASHTYPVVVDLTQLGERTAGESFTFTVHVNVLVTASGI